jgi:hypothetical protein
MWNDDKPIEQNSTKPKSNARLDTSINHDDDGECINDRFYIDINLTTCTVTDFIQQSFFSGDNTPIFAHVYNPILGTREALVAHHHILEALDLIKIIRTDLCRIMNMNAITQAIANFDEII